MSSDITRRRYLTGAAGLVGSIALLSRSSATRAQEDELTAPWSHPQGGPGKTAHNPDGSAPTQQFTDHWTQSIGEQTEMGDIAVSTDETLVVEAWPPVDLVDDIVALDIETGAKKWSARSINGFSLATDGETVYTSGDAVNARDPETGESAWSADVVGHLALTDQSLFVAGYDSEYNGPGGIFALDPDDGSVQWQYELDADTDVNYELAATDKLVYGSVEFGPDSDPRSAIVALDAATGEKQWETPFSTQRPEPAATPDTVCVTTGDGVVALEPDSGDQRWAANGERSLTDQLVLTANAVYVALDGELRSLDAASGDENWAVANLGDPALVDGVLYAKNPAESAFVTLDAETGTRIDEYAPEGGSVSLEKFHVPAAAHWFIESQGAVVALTEAEEDEEDEDDDGENENGAGGGDQDDGCEPV